MTTRSKPFVLPDPAKAKPLPVAVLPRFAMLLYLPEPINPEFIIKGLPVQEMMADILRPVRETDAVSTFFCYTLFAFVMTAAKNTLHQRLPDGQVVVMRSLQRDYIQSYPEANGADLPDFSRRLYEKIRAELPVLVRTLRAGRPWFLRDNPLWHSNVEVAIRILLRLILAARKLQDTTNPWYTQVCLRQMMRDFWAELFDPAVRMPDALKPWVEPLPMTLAQERQAFTILSAEGCLAGEAPPPPFKALVERWRAGEWPPEPHTEEEAQQVRGYL